MMQILITIDFSTWWRCGLGLGNKEIVVLAVKRTMMTMILEFVN